MTYKLVVLISGRGSNFAAILNAIRTKKLAAEIAAVISNNSQAAGLIVAKEAGIPIEILPANSLSRESYDEQLGDCIEQYAPDLIVLAGFMRILGPTLVNRFSNKIINIHPSLLPKYPGLHTHAQVIANRDTHHGATVHYVTEALDAGPIIAQRQLTVSPHDTPESVAARVLKLEHELYPEVIAQFVAGQSDA